MSWVRTPSFTQIFKVMTVGLIGSLLLTFSAVPEVIRTLKDKRCHLGWGFLLMWFFGEVFCTVYGFNLNELPLIINYTFNLFVSGIMVYFKTKESVINFGELPERLKERFAKPWSRNRPVGSNPTLSAKNF